MELNVLGDSKVYCDIGSPLFMLCERLSKTRGAGGEEDYIECFKPACPKSHLIVMLEFRR